MATQQLDDSAAGGGGGGWSKLVLMKGAGRGPVAIEHSAEQRREALAVLNMHIEFLLQENHDDIAVAVGHGEVHAEGVTRGLRNDGVLMYIGVLPNLSETSVLAPISRR